MLCQLDATNWKNVACDWLIIGVTTSQKPTGIVQEIDEALGGRIGLLRESGDLTGKLAELLPLYTLPELTADRLLLVGLGEPDELDLVKLEKGLLAAARRSSEKKSHSVAFALPDGPLGAEQCAQTAALALTVGCVGQDLYKAEPTRYAFEKVSVLQRAGSEESGLRAAVERGALLGEAINLTRELVNRSAEEIYPETFAARAAELADELGVDCRVLDSKQLEEEKMGAMLAVARGSSRPPRLVVLDYRGGGDGAPTLALCGKGVTFDSGGLSLKSNENMSTMKCDMAGAATVLGAVVAIARLKLPVNVRGFMGLVENMVSGSSYKLGDVLTARNGVTIEVLNTDAEGRLVLADVLSYAVDSGIDKLVDLATLTGSCVVALGEEVTGVFANDQPWCDSLLSAARDNGELVWQMPMFDMYADLIKSDIADVKNVGGRWGGAIIAAKFLEKFIKDRPWVHLDIAGPSFASSNKPEREGGATGCMLRTLVGVAERFR